MKYTELKKSIQGGAKGIYLLEGDDAYFRLNGEKMLTELIDFPELNVTAYSGDDIKGAAAFTEFTDSLKVFPFMAEKRMVKVSEFYPTETEYEKYLKATFTDFPSTTILVITNTGAKKCDLKKKKAVTFVDCSKSDRDTVVKWIYVTLKRAGSVTPVSVCGQIADYCMCDMSRVSVECDKLLAYKPGEAITAQDVDDLVYKDAEYRLYELTNAVAAGKYTDFCVICEDLRSKGSDEMVMMNSLSAFFRNMLTALSFAGTNAELASVLKVKEFGAKKIKEQAKTFGAPRLFELEKCAYSCIADTKSGQMTPKSAFQNLSNFIFFGSNGN